MHLHRKLKAVERSLECATRGSWYRGQSGTGHDPCCVVTDVVGGTVEVAHTKSGETVGQGATQKRLDNARHVVNTAPHNTRKMLAIIKAQAEALEFIKRSDTAKFIKRSASEGLARADILADEMAVML